MITAIIAVRMSSARFPGKALRPIAGRPMLQLVLERVAHAQRVDRAVVATSAGSDDDAVEAFCRDCQVACVRGSLDDVAARFLLAFDAFPSKSFVRINGDSPMTDPRVIDAVIDLHEKERADLATNTFPRTFPKGTSVEVFEPGLYRATYTRFSKPEHFEHVTSYFYEHASEFRISNLRATEPWKGEDLVVDLPEHAARLERTMGLMDQPHWTYGWLDVLRLQARAAATGAPR